MQVLMEKLIMTFADLFFWYVISISWSIAFLILVSIYLYRTSRKKLKEAKQSTHGRAKLAKDFVFVWFLLGLLALYIVSVNLGSSLVFAAGNIIVEVLLILYLLIFARDKSS